MEAASTSKCFFDDSLRRFLWQELPLKHPERAHEVRWTSVLRGPERSGDFPNKRMYYDQHVCGARIQELRKSKGYTQEALAEAIDIDAKRISKIERGAISASYNDMILFSEFFGVTLDYLIIGKR